MASPQIIGNIIVQNAMPDLLRAIESIYPICDKIYICDGGSTDGTWEWLQNIKDVYNLELFQHKYEGMAKQRNWLLSKTPVESWIISIDQDEKICYPQLLKEMIKLLDEKFIKVGALCMVRIPMITMLQDTQHCSEFVYTNGTKIFYYKEGVTFGLNDYHALPTSKNGETWMQGEVEPPIALKHYAFLDPKRSKTRCERLKGNKEAGASEYEFWCTMKHKLVDLPEHLKYA